MITWTGTGEPNPNQPSPSGPGQGWALEPAAHDALGISLKDSDADVRAYARRALEQGG
jgi:hypothetical protein